MSQRPPAYRGYRFPPEIISHAVWLYHRFSLSFRDVEDLLDILVQSRRNRRAATRFFRKVLKRQGGTPRPLVTDKLASYPAAKRSVLPSVPHVTTRYANNRAELSHQPTRQQERSVRRFKSARHAQRFLSVHGVVQNLFQVGRHLLRAEYHRLLRTRAFTEWDAVACAY